MNFNSNSHYRVLLASLIVALFVNCGGLGTTEKEYISFTPTWEHTIESTQAFDQASQVWKTFREKFPYHIQTIAIQKFEDDSYVFILSEPPNSITPGKILNSFERYNSKAWAKRNQVGVDGFTQDALIAVADIPRSEVDRLIKELNILLFDTDYKSDYYLSLPTTDGYTAFTRDDLNFDINTRELQSWFMNQNEKIRSEDGQLTNLTAALNSSSQIYKSDIPGFYFLVMSLSSDPADHKEIIRQFALDSDLILGAIVGEQSLALIGRERQIGLAALPPLRVETIIQLAAANKDQLSQSYERNMLLAGKLASGKDWAPIYLSNELINTEYGSLLNLTDQMLKSWSMNGDISYENWGHVQPRRWGFRGKGVMDQLDVSTLTFNWNTTGAVYNVPYGEYEVIGFNRTGSLPVSYFPEGMESEEIDEATVEMAENAGYEFFSELNNPDLVRVSQYAGIYQMFSTYGIYSSESTWNGSKPDKNPLTSHYASLYQKVLDLNPAQISAIGEKVDEDLSGEIEQLKAQLEEVEEGTEESYLLTNLLFYKILGGFDGAAVTESLDTLQKALQIVSEYYGVGEIAELNANPREIALPESDKAYASFFISETFETFFDDVILDHLSIKKDDVMSDYIKGYKDCRSNWIKTPSIVVSWSKSDSAYSIGGHNLGSRMTSFKIDKTLAPGKFRVKEVDGRKVVYSSSRDVNPRMLRRLSKSDDGLITLGKDDFAALPVRNRKEVFPSVRRERGLNDNHIAISRENDYLILDNQKFTNYDEFTTALKDRMAGQKGGKVELKFERFSEDEVHASLISSDFKFNVRSGKLRSFKPQRSLNFEGYTLTKASNGSSILVDIPTVSKLGSFKLKLSRISKEIMEAIVQAIDNTVAKLLKRAKVGDKVDNLVFQKTLKEELKLQGINPDDLLFQEEFTDLLISLLRDTLEKEFAGYA